MPWPERSATVHPVDWPATRRRIRTRDAGRCQVPTDAGVCGSTDRCQVDRVVPWSQGGGAHDANLRLTCHGHHALKTQQESRVSRRARVNRPAPVHPSAGLPRRR